MMLFAGRTHFSTKENLGIFILLHGNTICTASHCSALADRFDYPRTVLFDLTFR
ncbi:hypothetical protein [Allomuricauda sp. F6463D]|uniref:hypothetical protein n=1 Tax=Allomuricauda sp. F6463D TaxID=2926409 RepID=UPI001FF589C3|nr:hypothetical protein [Muricauda sp. F6463D]MCK0159030.1 hypothetical protein [Muricauda sp. F6463D]